MAAVAVPDRGNVSVETSLYCDAARQWSQFLPTYWCLWRPRHVLFWLELYKVVWYPRGRGLWHSQDDVPRRRGRGPCGRLSSEERHDMGVGCQGSLAFFSVCLLEGIFLQDSKIDEIAASIDKHERQMKRNSRHLHYIHAACCLLMLIVGRLYVSVCTPQRRWSIFHSDQSRVLRSSKASFEWLCKHVQWHQLRELTAIALSCTVETHWSNIGLLEVPAGLVLNDMTVEHPVLVADWKLASTMLHYMLELISPRL